ncbi:MAG TPA: hypothetical protein VGJ32_14310 [Solirubrobacteraceae bacterium]|jgi:hypothetical protein
MRVGAWISVVAGALLVAAPGACAQVVLPANDLNNLLALSGVDTPAAVPLQQNAEPPLEPVPRAECGPGSHPLEGVQGRVPQSAVDSSQAKDGWTCNVTPVSHVGGAGGFKTWRYDDPAGHECAYYDTALLHPSNYASVPGLPSTGVAVLDMSDPAHPKQTELLTELPMQQPHESLYVNERRGLLAAEMGNGSTYPGLASIYELAADCRHPRLAATFQAARFGHEASWSPDGKTFWVNGGEGIAAIDVTDPRNPVRVWEGNEYAHGSSVSADGNRVYVAEPIDGQLLTLDVSEIQARKPDPKVREVSRLTWNSVAIPQNTAPMRIDGHPYVLEFDEFAWRFTQVPQDFNSVGAARIVDMADEAHPRVVSNLRLEINQPEQRKEAQNDPGAQSLAQGYAAHYCAVPREVDPEIVACSFINSGLRIFDVRDPRRPREVAYFVAPPEPGVSNGEQASDFAMSKPSFAPERREVWYTDAISGFYALRLTNGAWPHPTAPARAACASNRTIVIHFPGRPALHSFVVEIAGKRATATRAGRTGVRITLARRPRGRFTVRVSAVTTAGRHLGTTRRYRTCAAH